MCACGPDWLPHFLKVWLSKKFNNECVIHDQDYEYKELGTCRFESDRQFLSRMVAKSKTNRDIGVAIVFFIFVRLFGFHRWKYYR